MLITSSAFKDGERIPSKYTCDGYGISPPVIWNGVPAGTLTLALIVEDVDAPAGVFTHWVIFNISSSTSGLQEGNPSFPLELPSGAIQGKNSLGNVGYVGPCPPSGTHRYVFHLYALDTQLNLPSEATRQDLLNAMQGHVLAEGQLTGLYSRS
jgi:Raf kinase inhibitor-like YbhB/YbcL family protein